MGKALGTLALAMLNLCALLPNTFGRKRSHSPNESTTGLTEKGKSSN